MTRAARAEKSSRYGICTQRRSLMLTAAPPMRAARAADASVSPHGGRDDSLTARRGPTDFATVVDIKGKHNGARDTGTRLDQIIEVPGDAMRKHPWMGIAAGIAGVTHDDSVIVDARGCTGDVALQEW